MNRGSRWVTGGALYVLGVVCLHAVVMVWPELALLSLVAFVVTLPASIVVAPIVTALLLGLLSLIPAVEDPGSTAFAPVFLLGSAATAVVNVVLVRALARAVSSWRTGRRERVAHPVPHVPSSPALSPEETAPGAPTAGGGAAGGRGLALLAGLAVTGQVVVALFTFLMGLGWGGLTYVAALLQVLAAFWVIGWLVSRGRRWVALVPLLSAGLTALLLGVGEAVAGATACSAEERAAVEELPPPPGAVVELQGEMGDECVAHFETTLSQQQVLDHYAAEFAEHGWQDIEKDRWGTAAIKNGVRVSVDGEPGLVVIRVSELE